MEISKFTAFLHSLTLTSRCDLRQQRRGRATRGRKEGGSIKERADQISLSISLSKLWSPSFKVSPDHRKGGRRERDRKVSIWPSLIDPPQFTYSVNHPLITTLYELFASFSISINIMTLKKYFGIHFGVCFAWKTCLLTGPSCCCFCCSSKTDELPGLTSSKPLKTGGYKLIYNSIMMGTKCERAMERELL